MKRVLSPSDSGANQVISDEIQLIFEMCIKFHNFYRSETHLREVAYCDIIKHHMMSLLSLSGDI